MGTPRGGQGTSRGASRGTSGARSRSRSRASAVASVQSSQTSPTRRPIDFVELDDDVELAKLLREFGAFSEMQCSTPEHTFRDSEDLARRLCPESTLSPVKRGSGARGSGCRRASRCRRASNCEVSKNSATDTSGTTRLELVTVPAAGGVSAPAQLKLVVCDQRGVHFVINDGEIVHPESTAACMDLHDGDFIECVFR